MRVIVGLLVVLAGCMVGDEGSGTASQGGNKAGSPNGNGYADTYSESGAVATSGMFFNSLGTNGRTCGSCHAQDQGFTITPAGVQAKFDASHGLDPLFRTNDGSVSPNADVSTESARRNAYKMLLTKGLIRVGIGIPSGAEFTLDAVDDPYGFASATQLSLFRRPLPTTNLPFLSTIMWDGRENHLDTPGNVLSFNLNAGLTQQANDATFGHAQATGTNPSDMSAIVGFENALFTAQIADNTAGPLIAGSSADDDGAGSTAEALSSQGFYLGINDPLGMNPTHAAFDPNVFHLFDAWAPPAKPKKDPKRSKRYAIYRGQQIFNTRPIAITGVGGINDVLGQPTVNGFCTTCHDTPNVGNHSVAAPLNIGLTDPANRTPDLPLYTLRNNATGEQVRTTDPGRALITGRWQDIGRFKGPTLRALAARAPYFHNGSAKDLNEVVRFYDERFGIGFSEQEKEDLVAFLKAL